MVCFVQLVGVLLSLVVLPYSFGAGQLPTRSGEGEGEGEGERERGREGETEGVRGATVGQKPVSFQLTHSISYFELEFVNSIGVYNVLKAHQLLFNDKVQKK